MYYKILVSQLSILIVLRIYCTVNAENSLLKLTD